MRASRYELNILDSVSLSPAQFLLRLRESVISFVRQDQRYDYLVVEIVLNELFVTLQ